MSLEHPELGEHTVAPPALAPLPGASEIERALTQACASGAADADTFAQLGNVLLRRGAYVDALEAYRTAADLAPSVASFAWMCAEIAHVLDDRETSVIYRARALDLRRVYRDPLPAGERSGVLLLLRDAAYSANAPLELILDRTRLAVHKYYVEGDAHDDVPHDAVAITAFGFAHGARGAIERAASYGPAINDPRKLERTARENVHVWANAIEGVVAPSVQLLDAKALAMASFPITARPVDTHAGEGFALLADAADAALYLERFPAERYAVAPFIDYRSRDGYYRKFRVIFVDGESFAYHHATSPQWMVHYASAPMDRVRAFREEEARFLAQPRALVPQWERIMGEIAAAVGLEYFGIDAAVRDDGGIVVFEADAAMLVHDEDARGVFAYKRPYVARIREALHALIERRRLRRTP